MKIGFVGLGKMGFAMVENLLDHKHEVVAFDLNENAVSEIAKKGATQAKSLSEMVSKLPEKKIIWLMINAGAPVDSTLGLLAPLLKKGDIVIDGGNSFYKDTIRRAQSLAKSEIIYLDCGTSGGVSGARSGACLMIGGNREAFELVEPIFRDLSASNDSYAYLGDSGAGHFVKMVHNGIEYGMMGAIGEGFEVMKNSPLNLDLTAIAKVYANGSIVDGKLANWLYKSFTTKGYLDEISGSVPKGATEDEMEELEKLGKMPILNAARLMRIDSRKTPSFSGKIISALRNQFGGHAVNKENSNK